MTNKIYPIETESEHRNMATHAEKMLVAAQVIQEVESVIDRSAEGIAQVLLSYGVPNEGFQVIAAYINAGTEAAIVREQALGVIEDVTSDVLKDLFG